MQEQFEQAIRTTQKEGGGVYVEAQIAVGGEIYTYAQHYSSDSTKPTYAKDVPTAVDKFKAFYYPLYVEDFTANSGN